MDVVVTFSVVLENFIDGEEGVSQQELELITKEVLDEEGLCGCADVGVGAISNGTLKVLRVERRPKWLKELEEYIARNRTAILNREIENIVVKKLIDAIAQKIELLYARKESPCSIREQQEKDFPSGEFP